MFISISLWIRKLCINFYFIIGKWFPHGNSNTFICEKWKNVCVRRALRYFSELIQPLATNESLEQNVSKTEGRNHTKFEEIFREQLMI